jgi:hypothetical protein
VPTFSIGTGKCTIGACSAVRLVGTKCALWSGLVIVACFALSILALTTLAGQTSFLLVWQQKVFPHAFAPGQRTLPATSNGYLLSVRPMIREESSSDVIHLNSVTTGEESKLAFWLPDASVIWIADAAATSGGQVFVAGSFLHVPDRVLHNFIATLDIAGDVLKTVDLGQYETARLCADTDGTVWTLGQDWGAEWDNVPYSMLRNYSSDGQLLSSYLPRKTLPVRTLALSRRLQPTGAPGKTFLRCGNESIGVYIGAVATWVEVRRSDKISQIWRTALPPASNVRLTGLALLGEHEVYGTFKTYDSNWDNSDVPRTARRLGLYRLTFGANSLAIWEPVTVTLTHNSQLLPIGLLIGSDGASLVLTIHDAKAADGTPILFWSNP